MLTQVRRNIVQKLWGKYRINTPQVSAIEQALRIKAIDTLFFDHFAVIDLPGQHTGIPILSDLFNIIGFIEKGHGYLAEKQNDFRWLAEADSDDRIANQVLPQVVIADFRLDEMPNPVRTIIQKYAAFAQPLPIDKMRTWAEQATYGDKTSALLLQEQIITYFAGRDWPLPTVSEFRSVQAFNELLAWVLIFGRQPNHFTLSIHLLNGFKNLEQFLTFIEQDARLLLNHDGGTIKGGEASGIAQASTKGAAEMTLLADGYATIPKSFVEFVWRYPLTDPPRLWKDFFTGFIAQHADHVIQSLYAAK